MFKLGRLQSFANWLFRRNAVETELDAEVRAFFDTVVQRHMDRGLTESEARRLARLEFDSPENAKEQVRDARAGAAVSFLARDIAYSFRRLRKSPTFAFVTVLTLALGIGANATIFSIVSKFILLPPPVGSPATLVSLHTSHHGECCNSFSWPLFTDLREQAHSFSGLAAFYELVPASIGGQGEPERVWGQAATANFFDVTQLAMTLGRGFRADEEHIPVVVLGHALWQRRFASDPSIAGKAINLSGKPFTVVGVAPPNFRGVDFILDGQFWVPLANLDTLLPNTSKFDVRDYHWLAVVGRLKPDVTPSQATAELDLLAKRILRAHPTNDYDDAFRFEQAGSLPPRDRRVILLFFASLSLVALMVLCIAAANVGNLFLSQAASRQRELAVRLALGATRGHLIHQMLTESILLALAGGVLGVLLSLWSTSALGAFHFPAPVPLDLTLKVDSNVLAYSFLLSLATGVLLGLASSLAVTRPMIATGIKGEDSIARPGRLWTLGNLLVVAQIAMSVVLLCATGLFLRSLQTASQIDIGFHSEGVLMMAVDPRLHGYSPERTIQLLNQLREKVAAIPGVRSATYTDALPLSGGHRSDGFYAEGQPAANRPVANTELFMTGAAYFETIGTNFISGQAFVGETALGPKVAVVNQALVDKLFKGQTPLHRRVVGPGGVYEITGVVQNVKSRMLGEEFRPVLYRSLTQNITADPSFIGYRIVVRFAKDPAAIAHAVREQIHSLDPTLAIFDAQTMQEHLHDALFLARLAGTIFATFGALGLILAAVGLYSVMNSWVTRRTREMGIRIALGARASEVQWLIVRRGMLLTVLAIIPGLGLAWAVSQIFTSMLYGIRPHDLLTFAIAPLFLACIAAFSCWLPARRASGAEPLEALRHE